jgi:hypothetical protein
MRITALDLLLGTPRLQRRIEAERLLLQRDLDLVEVNTQELRTGLARKATSLPALAAAAAGGFVATKLFSRPRRARSESSPDNEPNKTLVASTQLASQLIMPLLIGWVQARFAPPVQHEPASAPPESPTES